MEEVIKRDMTITNELFVRSFDKDTVEDEEAFVSVLFRLVCRDRIKIASKILSDYQGCDEYTPRAKKSNGPLARAPEQPNDEMKIESITEEEATKVVMTGTHEYPSAPGCSNSVPITRRCSSECGKCDSH